MSLDFELCFSTALNRCWVRQTKRNRPTIHERPSFEFLFPTRHHQGPVQHAAVIHASEIIFQFRRDPFLFLHYPFVPL